MFATTTELKNLQQLVAPELEQVTINLAECVKSANNVVMVNAINRFIFGNHGKRLRPTILLLLTKILAPQHSSSAILLATAIELIHIATLLHDDVIDGASERRGKATVNRLWGNQHAILAGDFLYSRAFQLILQIDHSKQLDIFKQIATVANTITEGEILQLSNQGNLKLSQAEYFKIIDYKTARLFALSANISAWLAADHKLIDITSTMGRELGLAYQLLDDYKDYFTDGNDTKEKKLTLPAIYFLQNSKQESEITRFKHIFMRYKGQPELLSELRGILKSDINSNGLVYTKKMANHHLDAAAIALQQLNNPYLVTNLSKFIKSLSWAQYD